MGLAFYFQYPESAPTFELFTRIIRGFSREYPAVPAYIAAGLLLVEPNSAVRKTHFGKTLPVENLRRQNIGNLEALNRPYVMYFSATQNIENMLKVCLLESSFAGMCIASIEASAAWYMRELPCHITVYSAERVDLMVPWGMFGASEEDVRSNCWEEDFFEMGFDIVGYQVDLRDVADFKGLLLQISPDGPSKSRITTQPISPSSKWRAHLARMLPAPRHRVHEA